MSMDVIEEELEDTKGVIRIRKSKNSHHNGDQKKQKVQTTIHKNIAHQTRDGKT